ncbi:cysteine synthase A [Methylomonas sp. AM2-LC]|uniref:cysteine synthase A n=1 Tax=Methylomonas sp. AM2-LC TaxID=3153301 RepID=UPI00326459E6
MASASFITQLIGNTPLVKLQRILPENAATVLVKLESRNPGGSGKDRIALAMIQSAEKAGLLKAGGTIVEPTAGNAGVALAMVASARGYQCILTMPENTTVYWQQLLKRYGAEVVLTPEIDGQQGAIDKARAIVCEISGALMLQQFENPANPEIHRQTTAQEIWSATNGNVDAFVCGVATGGTLTGVADVMKNRNPNFKVFAVEPVESPVLSGGSHTPHSIYGIGLGFIPKNLDIDLLDGVEQVSSEEAAGMRERLIREEGIIAGMSSAANVCAALQVASQLGKGKTLVTLIDDNGERDR